MKYTIVALPNHKERILINDLKNYFYLNWYRYQISPSHQSVHITLEQIDIEPKDEVFIYNIYRKSLKNTSGFSIKYTEVSNKIHDRISSHPTFSAKYPNWASRVALLYNSDELIWLSNKLISLGELHNIDNSDIYIQNIASTCSNNKKSKIKKTYIADHMNICNYCIPEMWWKAKKIILWLNYLKDIYINSIGLMDENWIIKREILLS